MTAAPPVPVIDAPLVPASYERLWEAGLAVVALTAVLVVVLLVVRRRR